MASWGMGLALLVGAISFATLLLSYFYLRVASTQWPPPAVTKPTVTLAAISSLAIAASGLTMLRALRAVRADAQNKLQTALINAGVLTVAASGVQLYDLTTMDFDAQSHAYGSIFYVLTGFMLVIALIGLVIDAVVLHSARKGDFTPRRHAAVTNAARYYAALTVMWFVAAATLYLVPRVA